MDPIDPFNLGPPSFRFVTTASAKDTSPAFSKPFKALATAIVLACGAAVFQTWLTHRTSGGVTGSSWFIAGWLLMLYTWWHILSSITRLNALALHQSWVWDKQIDLRELAYAKLIRVSGLDWLIAPRLYVRTLTGKFAVFYAASPAMLEQFERLAKELKAFRSMR